MTKRGEDEADGLGAALHEYVWALFYEDDFGLWELTWMAAGQTGRAACDHVEWAHRVVARLMEAGIVELFETSWPEMQPGQKMSRGDLDELVAADWCDPDAASTLVLVRGLGEPPVAP